MPITIGNNLDWALRLVVAMLCGGLIGYERTQQLKSAGIRTHMVVAVGAALTTIMSKYGFFDLIMIHNMSIDPTRVAAQIVSGISFIGAGTILNTRNRVSGLTTAAGVWSTAAIGMTVGAGLYLIAAVATVIIVAIQFIFHDDSILNAIMPHMHVRLQIKAVNGQRTMAEIERILKRAQVSRIDLQVVSISNDVMMVHTDGVVDHRVQVSDIIVNIQKNADVLSVTSEHV